MPPNSRPDLIRRAICNGVLGQIEWGSACFDRFQNDPEMNPILGRVKLLMREHVCRDGNDPAAHRETDPDWLAEHPDNPWWYCILVPVPEFQQGLFIKMKLLWEEGDPEDDAFAQLISIHKGLS